MSLKATNNAPISIITNDEIPNEYVMLFDEIIPIPFGDEAKDSEWKIQNRWKMYYASPYDKTIVLDTDMLVLDNIDNWWSFLNNFDVYYTSKVYDYRGNIANTDYYRKAFTENNLPNLFSGFHYFKKNDFALEWYREVETVVKNYGEFYSTAVKKSRPSLPSIDVCSAIAAVNLDCVDKITNKLVKNPTFTHMKPYCQNWEEVTPSWLDKVGCYINVDCNIKIGNYMQTGILHYTENSFIEKTPALERYKVLLNV